MKVSLLDDAARVESLAVLSRFRTGFYDCLAARADVLFELTDAVLCAEGAVRSLVDLTLTPEHRRSHGALYDALNCGDLDEDRLRDLPAGPPLPKNTDGRIVPAVDAGPWLRSDAPTSAERLFCHVYGRAKSASQLIPGWPYSFVAALEPGRTSQAAILDVVRLGPADDAMAVTAARLRAVIGRLMTAGRWRPGDPDILIVTDAGYDVTRLAFALADPPVRLLGRIRSDRVLRLPAPPRDPHFIGRPHKHGPPFALNDPAAWPEPQHTTTTETTRYGTATASSWDRLHPRLAHRACWIGHEGHLPIIEGTLIRLQVDHLPGDRGPQPVWPWSSSTGITAADVDRCRQSFLRRFDLEHTFRLFKQTLGWTCPKIRDPQAADRWTWLIIAAHTRLRLARPLATDLRRPWEKPAPPGSPLPASAAAFGTCAPRPSFRPEHRNPAGQAPADHPAPATAARHPATTWGRPPNETAPSSPGNNAQVKEQAKTEAEVTRKVRELEAKRDAGKTSKPGRAPTVAEWMTTWLDTIAARKVDQSTMDSTYRPKVTRWIIPRLGKHRLDALRPEHLDAFYTDLAKEGLAPNTVLQIHRILSRALKVATQREIIVRNVCTLVDAPQAEDAEVQPLTVAQARTLLALADRQRNGTRWSVTVALGLRQGEALGLRWKYVDLDRGLIKVHWQLKRLTFRHGCDDPHACGERLHRYPCPEDCPKAKRTSGRRHVCLTSCSPRCKEHNGKCPKLCAPDCREHEPSCPQRIGGWKFARPKGDRKREVPIPPQLMPLLKAHREMQDAEREAAGDDWEDWGLVWCRPDGRPYDRRADWGRWKDLLRAAGIDADAHRLHDARHTAGTLLGEQGVDIHVIQRILGHAQLSTTPPVHPAHGRAHDGRCEPHGRRPLNMID